MGGPWCDTHSYATDNLRPAKSGTCAAETLRRLTLVYILVECLNEYVIPVRVTAMSRLLNTHKPL